MGLVVVFCLYFIKISRRKNPAAEKKSAWASSCACVSLALLAWLRYNGAHVNSIDSLLFVVLGIAKPCPCG